MRKVTAYYDERNKLTGETEEKFMTFDVDDDVYKGLDVDSMSDTFFKFAKMYTRKGFDVSFKRFRVGALLLRA